MPSGPSLLGSGFPELLPKGLEPFDEFLLSEDWDLGVSERRELPLLPEVDPEPEAELLLPPFEPEELPEPLPEDGFSRRFSS